MKLLALLLTAACLNVGTRGYSQLLSVAVKEAPLTTVIQQVEKQSPYRFVFTREVLENALPVTLRLKDAPIEKVLQAAFTGQPLSYTIRGAVIVLRKRDAPPPPPPPRPISGRVTTMNGEPVTGATVNVKGNKITVVTNPDGEFALADIDPDATLVISSAEMETVEWKVNGKSNVSVVMTQRIGALDETIVVGYGTSTKRYSTGNVSKITAVEISRQPVANPLTTIQGLAPGILVQSENGLPGGNIKVQVRGRGSVAAGSDPLYMVDGVPFLSGPFSSASAVNGANGAISPFSIINPADIESIEILKDASETAIYGSRGANGVILITTKKGIAGKAKWNVDLYKGVGRISGRTDLLELKDYLKLRHEAYANAGRTPTAADAPDLLVWDTTRSTDWQDFFYGGNAPVTNMQLSLSAGDVNTNFLLGGNFREEGTVLPGDNRYRRTGAHLSFNHTSIDKRFSASINVLYAKDNNRIINSGTIGPGIYSSPNFPLYNPDGAVNWSTGTNPLSFLLLKAKSNTNNLVSSTGIRYRLGELNLRLSAGYSRITLDRQALSPKTALNPSWNASGYADFASDKQESYILEPYAEYVKSPGKWKLSILIGSTFQQTVSSSNSFEGTNYSNEDLLSNIGAAGTLQYQANSEVEHKYVSAFTRLHARFDNKYIFSADFRRDGSTRFGPDKEFGHFGSAGAGWIFTNEKFIRSTLPFLSYGKIRISCGLTGNDQIPDYAYLSSYGSSTGYQGLAGLAPQRLANPNYGWETNHKWESGIELGFWKDHLLFTASYYDNRSGNQLVPYPLPSQAGFSNYQANLDAVVRNWGWEFSLVATGTDPHLLRWRSAFNLTLPSNKLVKYPGLEQSSFAYTYETGKDLSSIKRIRFLEIDPATGIPMYEDVNKDGILSFPYDYQVVGKMSPDYYGGLTQTFTIKGFEASFLLYFIGQRSLGHLSAFGVEPLNSTGDAIERWTGPGEITGIPIPIVPSSTPAFEGFINLYNSDYTLVNSSYIRLKNVQLSYNFPRRWLTETWLHQCRLYLEAQNMLTWCRGGFIDPETLNGPATAIPVIKQFAAGVQLTL